MQEIAKGVFIEQGLRGVTVGAIRTSEGYILIDAPSFPTDAENWRAQLKNHKDLPIAAIIMLDSHRDRLLGASWFKPSILIAHAMTRDIVENLSGAYITTIANLLSQNTVEHNRLLKGSILKPTIIFTERMRLHFGDTTIHVEHRPGPTSGSIWVRVGSRRVLFVGDALVEATPPYLTSPYSAAWLEALDVLESDSQNLQIVSGRSGVAKLDTLNPLREYLTLARSEVQELYENRRPLSEMTWLIHRLMTIYPPPLEHDLDEVQQRVRTGLQFIYNEFREEELIRLGRRQQDSHQSNNP